jgi:hypothetical protein
MLSSPQWLEKAWGAYFAGRLHSTELQEPLVDALREAAALRDAYFGTEEYGYVAALFDAAIESEFTVPAAVLDLFEDKWRAPVVILLARDPAAEESLLRLRDQKLNDPEWLAVSNLLLGLKSQRFFAKALSEINISHSFEVKDPGGSESWGGGVGGGIYGDGVLAMPKGFPPIAVYNFVDYELKGDILLARGPQDVYYRRTLAPTDKQIGYGVSGSVLDRSKLAVEYLAALGNMTEGEAVYLFHQQTLIEFSGDDDLRQRWDGALSAQEAAIRAFIRTAQGRGLGSVTGTTLKIVPQLHDDRKITGGPVPALTPWEFVLDYL